MEELRALFGARAKARVAVLNSRQAETAALRPPPSHDYSLSDQVRHPARDVVQEAWGSTLTVTAAARARPCAAMPACTKSPALAAIGAVLA